MRAPLITLVALAATVCATLAPPHVRATPRAIDPPQAFVAVAPFRALWVSDDLTVVIKQGPGYGIWLSRSDQEAGSVVVREEQGVLRLSKNPRLQPGQTPATITISAPSLGHLLVNKTATVRSEQLTQQQPLYIDAGGSATVQLNLAVPLLVVEAMGQPKLKLSGSAEKVEVQAAGTGLVEAQQLKVAQWFLDLSNRVQVSVAATLLLDADLRDDAQLSYRGKPTTLRVRPSGNARVVQTS